MSFGLARGNSDLLFAKVDWSSVERHQKEKISNEIDDYYPDKLLNTSDDALLEYFSEKYNMDVPVLYRDRISVDQHEVRVDVSQDSMRFHVDRSQPFYVPATVIEVEVPFSGDGEFFSIQPISFSLNPPRGVIRDSSLIIKIQETNLQPERVKQQIEDILGQIETGLSTHRATANGFNNAILGTTRRRIAERKEKLLKDRRLAGSLGFPMKARDGSGMTYASPQVRKKISPLNQPAASSAAFSPEPVLIDAEYENILSVLSNMVGVMECSPKAFADSDEETIRTHFLMQLNALYQGQATGETFNYEGKTDILIKDGGRNIFIAECKFWRGEKTHTESINQLLAYLTWRDTKAAVLVFNRNRDFTSVLVKVREATESHPNFRKLIRLRSETSWVYRFVQRDDASRDITVTVMVFDVPQVT